MVMIFCCVVHGTGKFVSVCKKESRKTNLVFTGFKERENNDSEWYNEHREDWGKKYTRSWPRASSLIDGINRKQRVLNALIDLVVFYYFGSFLVPKTKKLSTQYFKSYPNPTHKAVKTADYIIIFITLTKPRKIRNYGLLLMTSDVTACAGSLARCQEFT